MGRMTKLGLAVFAGAAALALSLAAVAHAQTFRTQATQPDTASLNEAQKASLRHLKELLAVVNTGDSPAVVSYLKANTATPQAVEEIVTMTGLSGDHRGYDLVRVTTGPGGAVVGIVRNKLTSDVEVVEVKVAPQAPHHILSIQGRFAAASVAVTEEERLQDIGAYLKRMGDADVFSGAVVIAREGKPVFARAYGYADREKKIPNTADTPFLLGSINKLFTGLAIGQLVEQGTLSYEDSLAKFLPDYPDPQSAKKIKIKHLLSHTSGLGGDIFGPAFEHSIDKLTNVQAYIEVAERQPLQFEPGTKYAYNSLGFVLLGRVLEIATGQDYYEFMQKHVFAPAGATSASFPLLPRDGVAVVPMAYPYDDGWKNQLGTLFRRGSPAGSGIVSALDLLRLSNAMHAGRIVKPETLRLHSSPKPELGATNYGYGFGGFSRYSRPFVGHNGLAPGQCTEFGELRDTPYTIVVLSNLTGNTCRDVTAKILRVLRPSEAPAVK